MVLGSWYLFCMTNRLIEMYETGTAYIFQCHCFVAYNLSVSCIENSPSKFRIAWYKRFFNFYFVPFVSSKTKTIVKSLGLEVELFRFRFRFFIHQVLQQGKCLESGNHTKISKQQHWHTSTSKPICTNKTTPALPLDNNIWRSTNTVISW